MSESFLNFAGWTAFINAALSVANIVTLIIFFAIGGIFGRINDALSVFWALSFIPLLIVLYNINSEVNLPLSLFALLAGIAALLVFAVLQALLVMLRFGFERTLASVLTSMGILGLTLIVYGILALNGEVLPSGFVWVTLVYGIGLIIGGIGFWIGGQEHPLAIFGFLVTFIGGPVWAIWLGRLLLNGEIAPAVAGIGG